MLAKTKKLYKRIKKNNGITGEYISTHTASQIITVAHLHQRKLIEQRAMG